MKSLILFLIIFISFEMSAQTIKTFSINQKGVPLADSKNPYSLISLIGYNRYKLMHNKSFKALDSLTLLAIQQW
ncbi:hypothetical protein, partial [uncultured Fluviicola sp.]|uniref:hypothetical protein n=1 Tax=uncultured Fluviicola sp. TaxID=463303 RepID=UPI0025F1217F